MTSEHAPTPHADPALAAPADDVNPAIRDARKTFVFTVIGVAAFIGAVAGFIL
jgi:hypothetical protein